MPREAGRTYYRRDYLLFAQTIREAVDAGLLQDSKYAFLKRVVASLADAFEKDSPKFDREKFTKGCGL